MSKGFESTFTKIKTRGYWKVNVFPDLVNERLIKSVGECRRIMRDAAIQFRGWDYPHVPPQIGNDLYVTGNRVESWSDWAYSKEVWRFYQNGQFVNYFGIQNDWLRDPPIFFKNPRYQSVEPGTAMDYLEAVDRITEIFYFIRNLCQEGIYDSGLTIELSLHNMKDRTLVLLSPGRIPFLQDYKCRTQDIQFPMDKARKTDILDKPQDLSLKSVLYLTEQFGWLDASSSSIMEDIRKLVERRL